MWSRGAMAPGVATFEGDAVTLDPDTGGFAQIDLAPRLPQWADHSVAATVGPLNRPKSTDGAHDVETSMRVHAGSPDQLSIEVEYGDLAVYHGSELQFRHELGTSRSVRIEARPRGDSTSVIVDGRRVGSVDTAPHAPGGVSLTVRRGDRATQEVPSFGDLTIERVAPADDRGGDS